MNIRNFAIVLVFAAALLQGTAFGQGWERFYPAGSLNTAADSRIVKALSAPGGGWYVLVSDESNLNDVKFNISKIDESGHPVSTQPFDAGTQEEPLDMIATDDGGYLLLWRDRSAPPPYATVLSKLDAQLNVQFERMLGGMLGQHIAENSEGFWVVGETTVTGTDTDFFAKIDASGNLAQVTYPHTCQKRNDILVMPDQRILTAGIQDCFGAPINSLVLTMHDPQGTTSEWTLPVFASPTGYLNLSGLALAPDGGIMVAGSNNSGGYLAKVSAQGQLLWSKTYPMPVSPGNDFAWFYNVAAVADGSGYWLTAHDGTYIPRIVLVRTDLDGNVLSTRRLGMQWAYNDAKDILALPDGGCLVAGSRTPEPWQPDTPRPYLARISNTGTTFSSAMTGTVTADLDGDCLPDADTLLAGTMVLSIQNGVVVAAAQVGPNGSWLMESDTGAFQVTVGWPNVAWNPCQDTLTVSVPPGDTVENLDFVGFFNPLPIDSIFGFVFDDVDGDCLRDSFELPRAGWEVILQLYTSGGGQTFLATTDADGKYVFDNLAQFDNLLQGFVLVNDPPGDGLECVFPCAQEQLFQFANGESTAQLDFGVHCDSLPPCPIMEVDIATSVLRPCVSTNYYLNYCNNGGAVATDASIEITFDSLIQVLSSTLPWSSVNGRTYTFDLGNVAAEFCGSFQINVQLDCNAPVGQTFCVEAHAYPDTSCAPPGPNWDLSNVSVTGFCEQDSAFFILQNLGTGDMDQSLEYVVIEDNVLLRTGNFSLESGEILTMGFPANGHFLRFEAEQAPGFPGANQPTAWVEGCGADSGNPPQFGFVNQYYHGDADPWLDVFCLMSTNSYDPNDKTGFPLGYGGERFVEPNTEIEYLVRFQNTGTAPAINVEIRDTIAGQFLEIASVRPGASSHPYQFDLQGNNVVVFKFPNIYLPDSNANEAASHGFVKFRVRQKKDLPGGSKIENQAAIYFDFNAPVITNRTLHTVERDFIPLKTFDPRLPDLAVELRPNPAQGPTSVWLKSTADVPDGLRFRLFDPAGAAVLEGRFSGKKFDFDAGRLSAGAYFFEIVSEEGRLLGRGRFVRI